MELKLMGMFLIKYYSFAILFYVILRDGPFVFNIEKDGKIIEDIKTKKLIMIIVSIAWIVAIPKIILNSLKKL